MSAWAMWTIQVCIHVWEVCVELQVPLSLGLNICSSLWSDTSTLTHVQEGARRWRDILIGVLSTMMKLGSNPNGHRNMGNELWHIYRWDNWTPAMLKHKYTEGRFYKIKMSFVGLQVKCHEVIGERKGKEWGMKRGKSKGWGGDTDVWWGTDCVKVSARFQVAEFVIAYSITSWPAR